MLRPPCGSRGNRAGPARWRSGDGPGSIEVAREHESPGRRRHHPDSIRHGLSCRRLRQVQGVVGCKPAGLPVPPAGRLPTGAARDLVAAQPQRLQPCQRPQVRQRVEAEVELFHAVRSPWSGRCRLGTPVTSLVMLSWNPPETATARVSVPDSTFVATQHDELVQRHRQFRGPAGF